MNRKLLAREAKSLLQHVAHSKPFDWIVTGALVIILAWPKKVIWRPWPDWMVVTAMAIGGALVAYEAIKWMLRLKAAKDIASFEDGLRRGGVHRCRAEALCHLPKRLHPTHDLACAEMAVVVRVRGHDINTAGSV